MRCPYFKRVSVGWGLNVTELQRRPHESCMRKAISLLRVMDQASL